MRTRIALLCCLCLAGGALAQRALTLPRSSGVHKVEITRTDSGGVELTAYARTTELPDGGGVVVDRAHSCEFDNLTTSQKACLTTIRNAATACWNEREGL